MKTIWEGLLARLGLKRTRQRRTFSLDENQLQALETIAEQEQKSEQEIFTELFDTAVNQRLTNDELTDRWKSLSAREKQVTALTCLGYTNRQIAGKLNIAVDTVKGYMRQVLIKFNFHSKGELLNRLDKWDFKKWGPKAPD